MAIAASHSAGRAAIALTTIALHAAIRIARDPGSSAGRGPPRPLMLERMWCR